MPITDWNSGSANRTFWEIVARVGGEQYYMLQRLMNLFFCDSAELTGSYLDERVLERGLTRNIGVLSVGPVTLARSTPAPFDIAIPSGTMYSTPDKSIYVEILNDTVVQSGQSSVNVNANAGTIDSNGNLVATAKGNLIAGTSLIQTGVAITGIETSTVASPGFLDGTDTESDSELLARFLDAIKNPTTGGSKSDYEKWACQVSGVVSASCIPLARGNGTVDVVIISSTGIPTSDLIQQVQTYINNLDPVDADILVKGPTSTAINITLTYYTDSSSDFTQSITNAIQSYISSIGVGGVFRIALLINSILSVAGIKDVTITAPTQNVVLQESQIAVLGTLSIQKGV
jgi:uncharacterized phage protein gp47/JayE